MRFKPKNPQFGFFYREKLNRLNLSIIHFDKSITDSFNSIMKWKKIDNYCLTNNFNLDKLAKVYYCSNNQLQNNLFYRKTEQISIKTAGTWLWFSPQVAANSFCWKIPN